MFIYTLADVIFVLIIFIFIYDSVKETIKQHRCKHYRYRENSQCHGICSDCGKDLGFVGDLRKNPNHVEITRY